MGSRFSAKTVGPRWRELVDALIADADFDMLTGSAGHDWFIISDEGKITDLRKTIRNGDQVTVV